MFDPATGRERSRFPVASAEEVDKTVSIASAAFADWRNTSPTQRAQIMFAFRSLLDGAKNELADIIAGVHGKTKQDAMSCSTTKR